MFCPVCLSDSAGSSEGSRAASEAHTVDLAGDKWADTKEINSACLSAAVWWPASRCHSLLQPLHPSTPPSKCIYSSTRPSTVATLHPLPNKSLQNLCPVSLIESPSNWANSEWRWTENVNPLRVHSSSNSFVTFPSVSIKRGKSSARLEPPADIRGGRQ